MFDLAALEAELAGTIFAGKLHFARVTGSTNSDALAAARNSARRTARSLLPMSNWPAAAAAITDGFLRQAKGSTSASSSARNFPLLACRCFRLPRGWPLPMRSAQSLGLPSIFAGRMTCLLDPERQVAFSSNRNPKAVPRHSPSSAWGSTCTSTSFRRDLTTPATSLDLEAGRRISRPNLLVALLKSLEREALTLADPARGNNDSRRVWSRLQRGSAAAG